MVERIRKERALRRRAREAFDAISHPIRSASLFYALYWLTEIKNESQAGFDFMQMRAELYRSFQVYGIYTVMRELLHAKDQFVVNNTGLGNVDFAVSKMERILYDNIDDIDAEYGAALLFKTKFPPDAGWYGGSARGDRLGFTHLVEKAETEADAFSRPKRFLRTARKLFDLEGVDPEVLRWSASYGGSAWGGICSHLLSADDYGEVAWVNQCWSLQHNNSIWLDKIEIDPGAQDVPHRVYNKLHPNDKIGVMTEDRMLRPILEDLLDERKQGNMEPVFAYAWEYQDELEINLRQMSRRHGIGQREVGEWVAPLDLAMGEQEALAVSAALNTLYSLDIELPGELWLEYMQEADPLLSSGQMRNELPEIEEIVLEAVRSEGTFNVIPISKPKARTLVDALEDYLDLMTEPENVRFKVKTGDDPTTQEVRHVEGVAGRLKKKL